MNRSTLVPSSVVAEKYSVTPQTIYLWRKSGKIPANCYTKIGKTYRYDLGLLQAHFEGSVETVATQPKLFDLTPEGEDYDD